MDLRLELSPTEKTPAVSVDGPSGRFAISGCSIPENADRFYSPLQDLAERYAKAPAARTTLRIELSYFNSSSSKYLLDLMKLLADVHASGASSVTVEWWYAKDDLDMKEAGEDYRSLLDVPVKLKPRTD
ncbi:MAG TPA: DUF1987 domain-containing protein [Flavobacteriales bacterium]|nr:DUF1987 domain-containing protein [Flavobacteriales bacterium]HNU55594.1 DUF1987 domain-containing protein [Flavobacteriales bacterium]